MNNKIKKFRKRTRCQNKSCVILKVMINLTNIILSSHLKFYIIISKTFYKIITCFWQDDLKWTLDGMIDKSKFEPNTQEYILLYLKMLEQGLKSFPSLLGCGPSDRCKLHFRKYCFTNFIYVLQRWVTSIHPRCNLGVLQKHRSDFEVKRFKENTAFFTFNATVRWHHSRVIIVYYFRYSSSPPGHFYK